MRVRGDLLEIANSFAGERSYQGDLFEFRHKEEISLSSHESFEEPFPSYFYDLLVLLELLLLFCDPLFEFEILSVEGFRGYLLLR